MSTTPGGGAPSDLPGVVRVLAALSGERPDPADILAHLVADCAASCGATAVAILARGASDRQLELLAATSHAAAEMEVWQAQHAAGPCVEAIAESRIVHRSATAAGSGEGSLGRLMTEAGFRAVTAFPVAWRGVPLAGLNLFWSAEEEGASSDDCGGVYADLVALAIAHPVLDDLRSVRQRLARVLAERAVIEQAKGVLAWTEGLDMGAAYARLLTMAFASPHTLSEVAAEVVRHRGAPPFD